MSDEETRNRSLKVLSFPREEQKKPEEITKVEVNEDAIKALTEWLELAKEGKYTAVALVGCGPDRTIATESHTDDDTFDTVFVGLEVLRTRMVHGLLEDQEVD